MTSGNAVVAAPVAAGTMLPIVQKMLEAARLRHALGFEEIALPVGELGYEPRSSCQCARCGAVWVGTKSGIVMHLGLAPRTAEVSQRWFPGTREARSVCHLHDGLTSEAAAVLLVGRDDGSLEVVTDDHAGWSNTPRQARMPTTWHLHLDTWFDRRSEIGRLSAGACVERPSGAKRRFAAGITAIAAIPRQGPRREVDLLVATRNPWLYVIEADGNGLHLAHRIPLPGWIDWIFCPRTPDGPVRLLSRGGHVLCSTSDELRRGEPLRCHELPLLPTAALEADSLAPGCDLADLAVGTASGLVLIRTAPGGTPEVHAVPATRTGVHSIGSAVVTDRNGARDYMTAGLDDGRLRVFDVDVIKPWRGGGTASAITRSFSIDLGAPVLAVQTLRPAVYTDEQVYLLTALRDHTLRLFRITSEETQRARVRDAWHTLLTAYTAGGTHLTACGTALELFEQLSGSHPDAAAWAYAVVDVVLPDLHRHASELAPAPSAELRLAIVDAACALLRRDGPATFDRENRALHRAAATVADLAGNDVDLALRLSRAIVAGAVAARRATTSLLKDHVQSLAALCTTCRVEDRPKLVAWMRFLRKYILRGATFAVKRLKLTELVEHNYRARKHIDALIYQARLHDRGYDLRWELELGEDVAAVHSIAWPPPASACSLPADAPRAIVIVLTVSARLIIIDRASGKPISVAEVRGTRGRPAVFPDDHGPVHVLTSAVVVDTGVARLIVSCDGSRLAAPGLAIVDLRPHAASIVEVGSITYPSCAERGAEPVRVYGIAPLPGHPDTLVLGLNQSSRRVGRLRCARPWVVEYAGYAEDLPGLHHEPRHAPGTLPTRAVAVIAIDDDRHPRYLAALGSDDGQVLVCAFDPGTDAASWRLEPWSRLDQPIASVVLGRHEASGRLSCYLGTSKGDVLAVSIAAPGRLDHSGQIPRVTSSQPFGPYLARALWRDSHRARVIATQLWDAPMFGDPRARRHRAPVMVTATANGRLCIYRHDDTTTTQLSARGNYLFRGIRYDRVVLPDPMQALALADDSNELIASRPGGVVYLARLMYLRESHFRGDPDAALPTTAGLPDDSWGRMRRLLSESEIDEPFEVPPAERWQHKLELCELIQLDDGVLANYALRERWRELTPWATLPSDRLVQTVKVELRALRADLPADVVRLKLIFKSVGGAFLSQRLDRLRAELLGPSAWSAAQATATASVCKLLCDEIVGHLSHTETQRSRLAIVGMKELVRVPVLRAIGGRDASCRMAREAIEDVITACLRHDLRLVRTEALRSISVMLRNLGVMVKGLSPRERDQVIAALLPDEIDSVNWLIDPLIHDLRCFRGFKADDVLVSGAWYRASALAQLFWVFPDRALALCDHMVARGLPVEVLSLCIQVMRGNNVQQARHRIERFFYTDPRRPHGSRHEFIAAYRCDPLPALPETTVDPSPDDHTAECYLAHLHDLLARMWAVDRVEQLPELAERIPLLAVIPRNSRRAYGVLVRAVNELVQIASDLSTQGHRVHGQRRLAGMADPTCDDRKGIVSPIQDTISAIVAHWQAFPLPPEPGMKIGRYELGACVARRRNHEVFEIAEPAELGNKLLTVFRGSSAEDREAFVEAARFAHDIPGPGLARIDELVAVGSPYPAYRTSRPADDLESYLREKPEHAARWATDLTTQLCQALLHIHDHGRSHGDVLPGNVHVAIDALTQHPSITLGGFGNLAVGTWQDTQHAIPVPLSQKCSRTTAWNVRRWHDVVSLALLAFRALVGAEFSLTSSSGTEQLQRLKRAMYAAPPRDLPLFSAIYDVLEIGRPTVSIQQFSARLDTRDARPQPLPKVNVLFTAANPTDTTSLSWLDKECTRVRDELSKQERWHLQLIKGNAAAGSGCDARLTVAELLRWLTMGVDVVHFSGHGSRSGIAVWDHEGDGSRVVSGDALGDCFQDRQLTLVVLNSCYSEPQADTILSALAARNAKGAVVGTSHAVEDEAACLFSEILYQQLVGGRSIRDAFRAARNAVGMSGLRDVFVARGELDLVLAPSR